ncbi:UNKNOWN [Stylonychia lemnae]|uniref:Uncharacterized protein n=1 Tax=Stylonychia lemnae TaxID=5949 RepID=A0A078AZ54_STYLE|nr:UNKNOWN [Stylonychia lemnae]|eukprot:CDW87735.1 UNKNOWN [Stylonychia lemnae]
MFFESTFNNQQFFDDSAFFGMNTESGLFEKREYQQYDDSKSMAKIGQKIHLHKSLNKNTLMVVFEYLNCEEINRTVLCNKSLRLKVINDAYFSKVMIDAYQNFFFQQFLDSSSQFGNQFQDLRKRDTAATNSDFYEGDLGCFNKQFMFDQAGAIVEKDQPFQLYNCSQQSNSQSNFLTENIGDLFEFENKQMMGELQSAYQILINNKKQFVDKHSNSLMENFMVDATQFARELYLDPSQCADNQYLLPRLSRSSFKLDKAFSKTDKILVEKHKQTIFYNKTKSEVELKLVELNKQIQAISSSYTVQSLLNFQTINDSDCEAIVKYILTQVKQMALAHNIEMRRVINEAIRNNDKVELLDKAITLNDHVKSISKKVLNNQIVTECLLEYLVKKGILIESALYNQHISDGVLGQIINQVWRQEFLSIHIGTISKFFLEIMFDTHSNGYIHNIYYIKDTLSKMYRVVKRYTKENNEMPQNSAKIEKIDKIIRQSIISMLDQILQSTSGIEEFAKETKVYEDADILPEQLKRDYFNIKIKFIIKSFAKTLLSIIKNNNRNGNSTCNQLNIFQIIPQELQNTMFFKTIQAIQRQGGELIESQNFRYQLMMKFNIEQDVRFAKKFNSQLTKCFTNLQKSQPGGKCSEQTNEEQEELQILDRDASQLEQQIILACEGLIMGHDFDKEIRNKQEMDQQKRINQIIERANQTKIELDRRRKIQGCLYPGITTDMLDNIEGMFPMANMTELAF